MTVNSLKQYYITAFGKVQRVGFRDKVEEIALNNQISGYVQNLSTRDVCIVAEGKETDLEQFTRDIQNCNPPVKVSSIKVLERPYEGTYEDFIIIRGEPIEELAERFDHAIFYLHNIDTKQDKMLGKQDLMIDKQDQMIGKQDIMIGKQDQMIDKQDIMIGKQDQMIDKQDIMIGKQDQMIGKQDQMIDKQDIMIGKQDQMIGKQDQMIEIQKTSVDLQSKTLDEIHSLRNDFSDRFMHEISEARAEIRELRNELVQAGVLSGGNR